MGQDRPNPAGGRESAGQAGPPSERGEQSGGSGDAAGGPLRDGDGRLNRRRLLLLGGVATVGLFAITESEFADHDDSENEIRLVLSLNGHTIETRDIEGHMETVHPESPIYNESRQHAETLIADHNVTINVTVDSIAVDNRTAEAEVVRTTRGVSDDDYQDTREWVTYDLRRYEDEWRIYNRTVREREQPPAE